jgi:hypothetical protein
MFEYIEDNKKKADAFNIFICNQAMVDDSNVKSSPFLSDIHITEEQVFDHLSTLDISKASGPDGVGARLLKSAARELCRPLAQLFSKSLQTSTLPDIWKIASVVPVF